MPVRALLQQYFNIAFLMGKPQDLPAGRDQMKIALVLALVTYLMAVVVPYGLTRALLGAIVDFGFTALVLHLALSVMGKRNRFEQAFGALCGASAFVHLAAMPLYALKPLDPATGGAVTATLPDYLLLVWQLSLVGHIIRHTFDVSVFVSIVISFVFYVFLFTIITSVLPIPMAEASQMLSINWHSQFGIAAMRA